MGRDSIKLNINFENERSDIQLEKLIIENNWVFNRVVEKAETKSSLFITSCYKATVLMLYSF